VHREAAGQVEQGVDGAAAGLDGGDGVSGLVRVGEVGADHERVGMALAQHRLVPRTRQQGEGPTRLGEAFGGGAGQGAGRPCDGDGTRRGRFLVGHRGASFARQCSRAT